MSEIIFHQCGLQGSATHILGLVIDYSEAFIISMSSFSKRSPAAGCLSRFMSLYPVDFSKVKT